MATFNKFNSFVEKMAEGTHNLSSGLTLFLTNSAPIASNTVLADITQISYTNLSTRDLTVSSSSQTSGTYKLIIANHVLTASGSVPTFRYYGVYDSSISNELVCWFDHGSAVDLTSGQTFTINFDQTDGLLKIA